MLPAEAYAVQMYSRLRGHALFDPHPGYRNNARTDLNPSVEIGDVGYVLRGSFRLLFNIHRPANDPAHIFGVPEGFTEVPLNKRRIDRRGGPIGRVVINTRDDLSASVQVGASVCVL